MALSGATTRLIADQADAPLASLHYCYDSKEALFDVVFEARAVGCTSHQI